MIAGEGLWWSVTTHCQAGESGARKVGQDAKADGDGGLSHAALHRFWRGSLLNTIDKL